MESKPTWETCLCSARLCKRYVDMYSTLLITPSLTLSPESKALKDQVEWTSPFQQLKLLREVCTIIDLFITTVELSNYTNQYYNDQTGTCNF